MNLKELKRITQDTRGKGKEALDVRLVYRRISLVVTRFLIMTPIEANHITIMMFFLGLFSALSFFYGNYWLGFILILASIILDYVDGEVARYRNSSSKAGSVMDKIYHLSSMPLIFAGISYNLYIKSGNTYFVLIGAALAIFYLMGLSTRLSYFNILHLLGKKELYFTKSDSLMRGLLRRAVLYEYYTLTIYLLIISYLLNLMDYALMIILAYLFLRWLIQIILVYSDLDKIKTKKFRK